MRYIAVTLVTLAIVTADFLAHTNLVHVTAHEAKGWSYTDTLVLIGFGWYMFMDLESRRQTCKDKGPDEARDSGEAKGN